LGNLARACTAALSFFFDSEARMLSFRNALGSVGLLALVATFATPACGNDSSPDGKSSSGAPAAGSAGAANTGGMPSGAGTGLGGVSPGGASSNGKGGTGGATSGAGTLGGGATGGTPNGGTPALAGSAGTVATTGGAAGSKTGGAGGAGTGQGGGAGNAVAGAGASAGSGAGSAGSGGAGGGIGAGTLKIISVGDSITRATCWRAQLWKTLNTSHSGHFDLVGTLKSDNGCNVSGYDQDNQGYSSSLLTEVVAGVTNARTCDPTCPTLSDFATAFMTTKPDVALIHYGTNDVWNGNATNDITAGYGELVDKLRAANAGVKVLVAKIIPMNVPSSTCSGCTCSACSTAIPALNSAIDAWVATKTSPESPVTAVDQFTGFDATADTRDGVHPNDSGSAKMAAKWAAALETLF
jgi:lysophospholipase L1-like esterase